MPIAPGFQNRFDGPLAQAIQSGQIVSMIVAGDAIPQTFLHSIDTLLFGASASIPAILALADGLANMGMRDAAIATLDRGVEVASAAAERGLVMSARSRLKHDAILGLADSVAAARLLGEPALRAPLPETSLGDVSTLSISASPQIYQAVRDGVKNHPLREDPLRDPWLVKPARMSAKDDYSGSMEDYSFMVMEQDRPVLHVECDVEGDGPLANLQVAIRFAALGPSVPQEGYDVVIRHLQASARHAGAPFILLETASSDLVPPAVEDWLRHHSRSSRCLEEAWIDLGRADESIEREFRETHRQQVRWGRKNLSVRRWLGEHDDSLIDDLERLCRATQRYVPARDLLHQRLHRRQAVLYVANLDSEAVSAMIVGRHGQTSYYESGFAVRRGNAPLSHVLVAQAIQDAAAEGQDRFFLGVLHTDEAFSAKLRSIASFKRGFTRTFCPITWTAVAIED